MKVNALKVYNCIVPSDIKNVCSVVDNVVSCFGDTYPSISEDILFELKVVLNELFLNAIKHGNKGDSTKCVKLVVDLKREKYIRIFIEDQGEGFNFKSLIEKSKKSIRVNNFLDMKETGRGILIVDSLCDKITYNKKGNRVLVIKKVYN